MCENFFPSFKHFFLQVAYYHLFIVKRSCALFFLFSASRLICNHQTTVLIFVTRSNIHHLYFMFSHLCCVSMVFLEFLLLLMVIGGFVLPHPRRSNQSILKEISPEYSVERLMLKLNTLATWCEELTPWERPWCWERLKAGGEGDDRGWDGWMASPTQ